jgi:phosphate transport system substrate-binding protein
MPLMLAGCGEEGAARKTLSITGSSTLAPLMASMAKRFEAHRDQVRVEVQAGGSARGLMDARRGLADLGMVSRALQEDERRALEAHPVARDGICLIVHRESPVASLAHETARRLYTGQIENWGAVGAGEGPITVVHKSEGRATLEVFLRHFELENRQVAPDVVIGHNQQAIKTVAGNPEAIGYVSIGAAVVAEERGVAIRRLPAHGEAPTLERVASGDFPITRPLNLVSTRGAEALAQEFVSFAQSEQQHELVREHHYAPARR